MQLATKLMFSELFTPNLNRSDDFRELLIEFFKLILYSTH